MSDEINPRTGQVFYAGAADDVIKICRSLKIDEGRLSKITHEHVRYYMDNAEQAIDSYLCDYYFVPILPYNSVMPDGVVKKQFPGGIRKLARYWSAGLLLMSEYQQMEPNLNEAATAYIEDAKKDLYRYTYYNQRIVGQRFKSAISKTMPPNMQPALNPEQNW